MPDLGRLIVNVYGKGIGTPVDGAVIRILNNGGNKILTETRSNSCGKSEAIELPCPPKEYSLEYKEGMPKPYAKYGLEIMKNGFEPQRIVGVEILSGSTAIQNIILKPLNGWNSRTQTVMIREHALYADFPPKIPEDDVKPLQPPSGYIVLDKPVIPETIIVHDGLPDNASAPNYYVPFKDYIKNVASSEIYSTWPATTIRANVLAIISFTLNRVFTEIRCYGKVINIDRHTCKKSARPVF